jgi:hypothetical protein
MDREQLARNITAHGYGVDAKRIVEILSKLDDDEVRDLTYTFARCCEKLGRDAMHDEVD